MTHIFPEDTAVDVPPHGSVSGERSYDVVTPDAPRPENLSEKRALLMSIIKNSEYAPKRPAFPKFKKPPAINKAESAKAQVEEDFEAGLTEFLALNEDDPDINLLDRPNLRVAQGTDLRMLLDNEAVVPLEGGDFLVKYGRFLAYLPKH